MCSMDSSCSYCSIRGPDPRASGNRLFDVESYRFLDDSPRCGAAFDAGVRREEMMLIQLKHIDFKPVSVTVDREQRKILVIEVQSKGEKTTSKKESVYVGTERLKNGPTKNAASRFDAIRKRSFSEPQMDVGKRTFDACGGSCSRSPA